MDLGGGQFVGNASPDNMYLRYPETTGSKKEEIEDIRQVLELSTQKTLWEVLNEARQQVHPQAVKNKFLLSLTTGGFCSTAYVKYLIGLLPIHQALEDAQKELLIVPCFVNCVVSDLFRSKAIQMDIDFWITFADTKIVSLTPPKITLDYADYIRQTAKDDPERIVAIIYTLYGTVMSGGQMNKRGLEKAIDIKKNCEMDLPEGTGVALFELPGDVQELKKEWHIKLCEIEKLYPKDRKIEDLRVKLTDEVKDTIKKILEIIETTVESSHC